MKIVGAIRSITERAEERRRPTDVGITPPRRTRFVIEFDADFVEYGHYEQGVGDVVGQTATLHSGTCVRRAEPQTQLEEERDEARREARQLRDQLATTRAEVATTRAEVETIRRQRDRERAERGQEVGRAVHESVGEYLRYSRPPTPREAREAMYGVDWATLAASPRHIRMSLDFATSPPAPVQDRPQPYVPRGGGFAAVDALAESMKPKPEPKPPTRWNQLEVD